MKKLIASILLSPLALSSAFAADGAASSGGSGYESILLLVVFFAIFYFLLIRPQMKRNKEHKSMMGDLAKGDEVITNGGIAGKVSKVDDMFVEISIAENVDIKVQKQAIQSVLPKGTLKN